MKLFSHPVTAELSTRERLLCKERYCKKIFCHLLSASFFFVTKSVLSLLFARYFVPLYIVHQGCICYWIMG